MFLRKTLTIKRSEVRLENQIKIISEKLSRALRPDYYLVLPWHFKEEISKRESNILKKGVKFIFPLPNIQIVKRA